MSNEKEFWNEETLKPLVSNRSAIMGGTAWAAYAPDPRKLISFAGGIPDVPSLPNNLILDATERALKNNRTESLQYGGTLGPIALRTALAERSVQTEQFEVRSEHVIITGGAAQGIGLVCDTLLNPGDVVLVETPTFPGTIRTLKSYGVELIPIEMDSEGVKLAAIEDALTALEKKGKKPKFLYCIPTHQNPTGKTLSLERRKQLLTLCSEHQLLILEDDPYGEIWFEEPPPSLFSLSEGGTIRVLTFSKIVATGLRLGWTLAPPDLISRMAALRYDMGSSVFLGNIAAELIRSNQLENHIKNLRGIYSRKLTKLEEALELYCGEHVRWERPAGGFFLWLELLKGLTAEAVVTAANEEAVIVGNGNNFNVTPSDSNATEHIRIAFSYVPIEEIEEGIHRLGDAMKRILAEKSKGS